MILTNYGGMYEMNKKDKKNNGNELNEDFKKLKRMMGDDNMENVLNKDDCMSKKEIKNILDEISDNLPLANGKNGVILLDKSNPDDVAWYNEDED